MTNLAHPALEGNEMTDLAEALNQLNRDQWKAARVAAAATHGYADAVAAVAAVPRVRATEKLAEVLALAARGDRRPRRRESRALVTHAAYAISAGDELAPEHRAALLAPLTAAGIPAASLDNATTRSGAKRSTTKKGTSS